MNQPPCLHVVSQIRLSRPVPSWVLKTSGDEDSTASLASDPYSKEVSYIQVEFAVFSFVFITSHHVPGYLSEVSGYVFFILLLEYHSSCYSFSDFSMLHWVKNSCTYKDGQHTLGSLWSEMQP